MMVKVLKEHNELTVQMVEDLLKSNGNPMASRLSNGSVATLIHGRSGKPIRAKTVNQRRLIQASEHNDIVFAIGPAGTGKTYTAVALAVRALKNRVVKKIFSPALQ